MSNIRTNRIINRLLPVLMAFMLLLSFGGIAKAETAQKTDVVEISSVEDLSAINQNLSGHYVLIADIDIEGREWTPIGTYSPSGESEEEQEIPSADYAFTGTFDGKGHTIRNLSINQPEGWALGLFGCIANAEIGHFTLENATVDGSVMAADVVGYTFFSTISDLYPDDGTGTVRTDIGHVPAGLYHERSGRRGYFYPNLHPGVRRPVL